MALHLFDAVLLWVAAWSVATFAAVAVDKRRAQSDRPRVPERALLMMALVGGSVGLVLGMWLFGHKIRKLPFLGKALLVLLLHVLLLMVLLGGAGGPPA